jgi:Fe-S cluster assembly protein SufD
MSENLNKNGSLQDLKINILSHFDDKNKQGKFVNADIQQKAIKVFDTIGFPSIKNEEWKYTNLSKFIGEDWTSISSPVSKEKTIAGQINSLIPANFDAHRLVFTDGAFRSDLSEFKNDEGLTISTLAAADPTIVKEYLGKNVPAEINGLTALNTAFASGGVFIKVTKGVKCKYAVQLVFISGNNGDRFINNIRNLIILEEGSSLELIETYYTIGGSEYLSNIVTEIFAERGAILDHYRFQNEDKKTARQVNFTSVSQKEHSLVNNFTITTGGQLVRNDLNYRMIEKECESHMYGLYIGSESQHIDNHTLMDHAMPQCYSNEFYKGIMADKSTGVFNGKVIVRPDAQKTNAYQSNKNILLSDDAHINTKPQLEIFANDVKCSHGATTGQLDEEALFYLRSRGIGASEAKAMLTAAFAADVLENIKRADIREYAIKLVSDKLNEIASDNQK